MSILLQESVFTEAINRVSPHVYNTPVLTSRLINKVAQAELYFKCDNFQKGGSYKIRGATNAVLQLTEAEKSRGVVTHSSGNFAAALTLAAANQDVKAYIVMPENAPSVKRKAVEEYGAEIITCPSTLKDREEYAAKVVADIGATLVHPSNDGPVILGQATMTAELLREQRDLDFIVCPIGGGGVGAGACLAKLHMSPDCKIVGAEPENAADAYRSLEEGKIMPCVDPNTIADGLRSQLGDQNFPILKALLDRIILVSDDNIIKAMRLMWERMKIIIEPSSAITLAAIIGNPELFKGKKVGLIITGGNVSLDNLPF